MSEQKEPSVSRIIRPPLWLALFLFLFTMATAETNAQVVFEPVSSSVYSFLHQATLRGISFPLERAPLPRFEIASILIRLQNHKDLLTDLQKQELEFYAEEFQREIKAIAKGEIRSGYKLPEYRPGKVFNLFTYDDSLFHVKINPVLGTEIGKLYGESYYNRWNGFSLTGTIGEHIGFSSSFKDQIEHGSHIDRLKNISPDHGVHILQNGAQYIDYSNVFGSLTYSWQWGEVSIRKDYIVWGSGQRGQIILSTKAPSFPHVLLEVYPVEWLRFSYLHGFLSSDILDSSSIRWTHVSDRKSYRDIPKFIAAHWLTLMPIANLHFSVGESIVYSNSIEPLYLNPLVFIRASDHYLSKDSINSGDNAQIFADVNYLIPEYACRAYATLFIDELSVSGLLRGDNLSAIAYTIGCEFANPLLQNSMINLEYSRLNPFVYHNSDDAQEYLNHGYPLGHWIGSNGDIISAALHVRLLRGLSIGLAADYIRKGRTELPAEQYILPYPHYLYGARLSEKVFTTDISYEYVYNLKFRLQYQYTDLVDEEVGRSQQWQLGTHSNITISCGFGF